MTDMASFIALYDLWTHDGEMYHEMGLGHIGHLLSCQRDGTLCYRCNAPEDAS